MWLRKCACDKKLVQSYFSQFFNVSYYTLDILLCFWTVQVKCAIILNGKNVIDSFEPMWTMYLSRSCTWVGHVPEWINFVFRTECLRNYEFTKITLPVYISTSFASIRIETNEIDFTKGVEIRSKQKWSTVIHGPRVSKSWYIQYICCWMSLSVFLVTVEAIAEKVGCRSRDWTQYNIAVEFPQCVTRHGFTWNVQHCIVKFEFFW